MKALRGGLRRGFAAVAQSKQSHSAPQILHTPGGGAQLAVEGALNDNYALVLKSKSACIVVDSPEENAIMRLLDRQGWSPTHIVNTHHHWDHTGANEAIKDRYSCEIVGSATDSRIPAKDRHVSGGERIQLGDLQALVLETPGHTSTHLCFYFEELGVLLAGDTLFSCGCGRLLEGNAEQMLSSLQKLDQHVADDTLVACAHEVSGDFANESVALAVNNQGYYGAMHRSTQRKTSNWRLMLIQLMRNCNSVRRR